MRLHRNLVYTTIDSLNSIFNEGEYADKMVARALKKYKRWGSSDRKFVAETIYEIVRWKRLYAEIAEVKEPYNRENLWRIFSVWAVLRGYPIPDWKQLEGTPERKIKGRFDELSKIRTFKESIPDWMDELGVKELGEKVWAKEIAACWSNSKPVTAIWSCASESSAFCATLARPRHRLPQQCTKPCGICAHVAQHTLQ
jgi:16S rRNA (cytosine967-C5)-methyltransferase